MSVTSDITIQITLIIFGLLAVLFTLLILYTAFHRFILNRRRIRFQKSEEYVLPQIYKFLDGQSTLMDFANAMRHIVDIVVSFKNLNIMIDNLKGEEQVKLRQLLELPQFEKYYLKKLHSRSPIDLADACMYFEKINFTDDDVLLQLVFLQEHSYSVLVYASTLALINMSDQSIRDEALYKFLKSTQNASMAISDIIFKYCSIHENESEAADYLGQMVAQQDILPKTAAYVIRMFPTLGYYQLSDLLLKMLKHPPEHDSYGIFVATLISVLDQFAVTEVEEELLKQKMWKSKHQVVRLATASWILNNYSGDLDYVLLLLSSDADLEVRIVAQKALTKSSNMDLVESLLPKEFFQEWTALKMSGDSYANTV